MRYFALFLFLILLNACSPAQDQTPKVAEDQRNALEKAKTLEADLQKSAEEQAKQVQSQTE